MTSHQEQISSGQRFEFGKNWSRFLRTLNDERIVEATESLRNFFSTEDLTGRRFLDVGCGSGLFSLAARRLGAAVHSFDFDPQSVACTLTLRERFFPQDEQWTVEEGSVLDKEYLQSLGQFDIVYSWGVLHHTGRMHEALENVLIPLRESGMLYIAIYNDQGRASRRWKRIKKFYCDLPRPLRLPFSLAMIVPKETRQLLRCLITFRPHRYVRHWTDYSKKRGMSRWHDHVDWLGGYPYEFAKPEEMTQFFLERGYTLIRMRTVGGMAGCNEFTFADWKHLEGNGRG
ncbi:MAG: class I SAM-dependent methyltransferase [Planctomycetes bacterium]|nr:class I SAM-dependent methyltransferase [Planctomycetota bacterium]